MALFRFFLSREQREAELKQRVRQGTLRIGRFVQKLQKQADDYASLARRAWELDDQSQFRLLISGYLKCLDTINRWERYVVRLKALELQRGESDATREFLSSMNALTSSILTGVRPEDVALLGSEMEAAITRSEELSEALSETMEQATDVIASSDLQAVATLLKLTPAESGAAAERPLPAGAAAAGSGVGRANLSATVPGRQTRSDSDFWAAVENARHG